MVRKSIFIIIACIFISVYAEAQYFNSGIKAGIVGSQVDGDGYGGFDKLGFNMGLFVNYQTSMRTSFQLELEYIQKGSNHNPNYDIGDYNQYKISLGYIQIPLLLQYKIYPNFSLELGPAFGVLLSHYEERDGYELESNPFRKFALSGIMGFNYKISENWNTNFRMDYSLIGLREKSAPGDRYILFQWGQFNNGLILSLQYIFNHAKDK